MEGGSWYDFTESEGELGNSVAGNVDVGSKELSPDLNFVEALVEVLFLPKIRPPFFNAA